MDPSKELICPLSLDLMTDPVMLVETGEIFERSSIQGWFDRGNRTDPWTRQLLSSTRLVPVRLLRRLVEDWIEQQTRREQVEQEQGQTRAMLGANEDDGIVFIEPERLTLGREIGSGATGVVRVATLHPAGQEVAVKMLSLQGLTDSSAFRREVKVLQRASTFCHNVCRFLGVSSIQGSLCIVMFKYERSLEDVIKLAPGESANASVHDLTSSNVATGSGTNASLSNANRGGENASIVTPSASGGPADEGRRSPSARARRPSRLSPRPSPSLSPTLSPLPSPSQDPGGLVGGGGQAFPSPAASSSSLMSPSLAPLTSALSLSTFPPTSAPLPSSPRAYPAQQPPAAVASSHPPEAQPSLNRLHSLPQSHQAPPQRTLQHLHSLQHSSLQHQPQLAAPAKQQLLLSAEAWQLRESSQQQLREGPHSQHPGREGQTVLFSPRGGSSGGSNSGGGSGGGGLSGGSGSDGSTICSGGGGGGGNTGGIPYRRMLLLAIDVALAMADLHRQRIVVADLKPANVLLDRYDRAVVADFGISTLLEHTLAVSRASTIVGSVNYMAPEQHAPDEGGGVTAKADVWAFGGLLLAMATGRHPWEGLQMRQVITNVLVRQQAPRVPGWLPEEMQTLIQRCFCHDPEGRPSSEEVLGALREAWGRQLDEGGLGPGAQGEVPSSGRLSGEQTVTTASESPRSPSSPASHRRALREIEGRLPMELASVLAAKQAEVDRLRRELMDKDMQLREKDAQLARARGQAAAARHTVMLDSPDGPAVESPGGGGEPAAGGGGQKAIKEWLDMYRLSVMDNPSPSTSLHIAAKTGRLDVVHHLLQYGMSPNLTDQWGDMPLHHAAAAGQLDVVKVLISAGAMMNVTDHTGAGALHLAAANGHVEVLTALLRAGAKVNLYTNGVKKLSALHIAAAKGLVHVVRVLHAAKADLNAKISSDVPDDNGYTALHQAITKGHVEVVRFLLETGKVDVNLNRSSMRLSGEWKSETPLDLAISCHHNEVVDLLRQKGGVTLNNSVLQELRPLSR